MARFDPRTWSRETRLLIITVVLSLAVLLTLARFRFPVREPLELPARPLERLTERSPLDDTSAIVQRVRNRVDASLIPVRLDTDEAPRSFSLQSLTARPAAQPARFALALRIDAGHAVMLERRRAAAATGPVKGTRGRDRLLGLTLLDVEPDPAWTPLPTDPAVPANFVIVAEPGNGLAVLRPAYSGADGFVENSLWNAAVTPVAIPLCASCSAFAFTLNGSLVGAVTRIDGTPAVVPASAIFRAASRLATGAAPPSTLGVHVQELDPALARATGAQEGVVIAGTDPGGPASSLLQPGDVLIAVDGRPVTTPEHALAAIARLAPGRPVKLQLQRDGARLEVDATPQPDRGPAPAGSADPAAAGSPSGNGLSIQRTPQGLVVTTVAPGSPAQRAGLRTGDVITSVNGKSGSDLQRLLDALRTDAHGPLLLGIARAGNPLVLAWPQPDGR